MNQATSQQSFDYVIVGGGSAGCVLANRLSEDPDISVCLLEAGLKDRSPFIHIPVGLIKGMMYPKINWMFMSKPQERLNNRPIFMPRGKTLGGSSSINGMIYIRGNQQDYDTWAELGNSGWGWRDVLPYFKRSENNETYGGSPKHGQGGPLNVTYLKKPSPLHDTFLQAIEAHQYKRNPDFNSGIQEGFGIYQVTQKNGRRHSTAQAFLKPALNRPNLTVITGAPAERVVIQNGRAVGIDYRQKNQTRSLRAEKEVLLSAGAIQSPQLLLLSGIGPANDLKKVGLDIQVNLPGVGKNLQDHAAIQAFFKTKSRIPYGLSWKAVPAQAISILEYLFFRRGLFASNVVEGGGFYKTDSTLTHPDIQYIFSPGFRLPGTMISMGHGYLLSTVLLRPKSRGELILASNDPSDRPIIDPNFFEHEEDFDVLLKGFQESRKLANASEFDVYNGREIIPGRDVKTERQVREYILNNSQTIFHPVGTCKMGSDEMAVVDDRLRVRGLEGLRVVDASIMPTIVSGNTNAPVIMIAEKAADMVKEDR